MTIPPARPSDLIAEARALEPNFEGWSYRALDLTKALADALEISIAHEQLNRDTHASLHLAWKGRDEAHAERDALRAALEKIADPRKRDHKEPDAYTELGCVMNIASEALDAEREKGDER